MIHSTPSTTPISRSTTQSGSEPSDRRTLDPRDGPTEARGEVDHGGATEKTREAGAEWEDSAGLCQPESTGCRAAAPPHGLARLSRVARGRIRVRPFHDPWCNHASAVCRWDAICRACRGFLCGLRRAESSPPFDRFNARGSLARPGNGPRCRREDQGKIQRRVRRVPGRRQPRAADREGLRGAR